VSLKGHLHLISNSLERRLFEEYGAIFATTAVPPSTIIFRSESEVAAFLSTLEVTRNTVGEFEMELQSAAMESLLRAQADAESVAATISARCADSGRRSYQETVQLWLRNVNRGLDHWLVDGRITTERADSIRALEPFDQVELILELEDRDQIYFGTYFDKSILYSVAAPGASQHLSLLAFDLAEYRDESSEKALAANGWFRTVKSDLPHFTYLGLNEAELPAQDLEQSVRMYDGLAYRFWTPKLI
jgi:hypothetical protein